jgi:cell pole-organizing protein PopZ
MEEILASIRQIISEDGEASQPSEGKGAQASIASAAEAPAKADEQEDDAGPEPIQPIAAESIEEPEPHTEPEPEPDRSFAYGEPMTPISSAAAYAPEPAAQSQPATIRREERNLLSPQSDQAVHGAFSALAHTILAQNARTLEDLVAEMLQPMLKSWLDDNLPALVERLVQDEIQRVSRGRP